MSEPMQKPGKMERDYLPLVHANPERFWSKVERGPGCWDWTAGKDKEGYGFFVVTFGRILGRQQMTKLRSHRLAFELVNGYIPDGMLVLHGCDNPSCCRPDHLRAGTQMENRADAVARGRTMRGARHVKAKLTEESAREVIRLRDSGVPVKEIAVNFGIATVTVYQIGRNNWKHLT